MRTTISVHVDTDDALKAKLGPTGGIVVLTVGDLDVYIQRSRTPGLFADVCEHFDLAPTRDSDSEHFGEAGHSEAHLEDPPEEEENDAPDQR